MVLFRRIRDAGGAVCRWAHLCRLSGLKIPVRHVLSEGLRRMESLDLALQAH